MNDLASNASPDEVPDPRLRRLLFRSWRRGTQESDLILGSFADDAIRSLNEAQLVALEALLDCADADLFDWIFGVLPPPPEHDHDVMRRLRTFCAARGYQPQRIRQPLI